MDHLSGKDRGEAIWANELLDTILPRYGRFVKVLQVEGSDIRNNSYRVCTPAIRAVAESIFTLMPALPSLHISGNLLHILIANTSQLGSLTYLNVTAHEFDVIHLVTLINHSPYLVEVRVDLLPDPDPEVPAVPQPHLVAAVASLRSLKKLSIVSYDLGDEWGEMGGWQCPLQSLVLFHVGLGLSELRTFLGNFSTTLESLVICWSQDGGENSDGRPIVLPHLNDLHLDHNYNSRALQLSAIFSDCPIKFARLDRIFCDTKSDAQSPEGPRQIREQVQDFLEAHKATIKTLGISIQHEIAPTPLEFSRIRLPACAAELGIQAGVEITQSKYDPRMGGAYR